MLFNFGKCKGLHTGPGNTGMNYEMGGTILSKTVKEKYLGVTMNANMKVSEQCRIAASKGNQVLGMIRRNISYKEKSLIVPLYKAIVRPHLEYCIQAWSPYLRKDIDMLDKIQRRATKLIPGLRGLSYEERLQECGLTTLETRRLNLVNWNSAFRRAPVRPGSVRRRFVSRRAPLRRGPHRRV